MDQTCIDTDDDDLEFDNADQEENEDVLMHETSAYMVSKTNISRYQEMTQRILETGEEDEEESGEIMIHADVDAKNGQKRVVKPERNMLANIDKPEIPKLNLQKKETYSNMDLKINPSSVASEVSPLESLPKKKDSTLSQNKFKKSPTIAKKKSTNTPFA
jgi:hypothetical protein